MRETGFDAILSMRLEKSIGIWNAEFTQGYTPAMTGHDRWIDWDKGEFIGKQAAKSAAPPARVLRMLELDADNADPSGFESVWRGDKIVGMSTSGGFGHRLQRSFALALVDTEFATSRQALDIHVVGDKRPATIIDLSPYDPSGSRMRAWAGMNNFLKVMLRILVPVESHANLLEVSCRNHSEHATTQKSICTY